MHIVAPHNPNDILAFIHELGYISYPFRFFTFLVVFFFCSLIYLFRIVKFDLESAKERVINIRDERMKRKEAQRLLEEENIKREEIMAQEIVMEKGRMDCEGNTQSKKMSKEGEEYEEEEQDGNTQCTIV